MIHITHGRPLADPIVDRSADMLFAAEITFSEIWTPAVEEGIHRKSPGSVAGEAIPSLRVSPALCPGRQLAWHSAQACDRMYVL